MPRSSDLSVPSGFLSAARINLSAPADNPNLIHLTSSPSLCRSSRRRPHCGSSPHPPGQQGRQHSPNCPAARQGSSPARQAGQGRQAQPRAPPPRSQGRQAAATTPKPVHGAPSPPRGLPSYYSRQSSPPADGRANTPLLSPWPSIETAGQPIASTPPARSPGKSRHKTTPQEFSKTPSDDGAPKQPASSAPVPPPPA